MPDKRHSSLWRYGSVFLVAELMSGGELRELLNDKTQVLDWPLRLRIAQDIAEGVAFLHGKGLIHRDLKSLNILLDDERRAKIADFGLSRFMEKSTKQNGKKKSRSLTGGTTLESPVSEGEGDVHSKTMMTSARGTPHWAAPEVLAPMLTGAKTASYTVSADVYRCVPGW